MVSFEEITVIKLPVEAVFAYLTDPSKLTEWESNMLEAEQTSPGKMGLGATSRGVIKAMGRRMKWTSEVAEWEPNSKYGESVISGSTRVVERFSLEPADGGTKLTLVYEMYPGGLLKLLEPVLVSTVRRQTRENLNNLKNILEAGG